MKVSDTRVGKVYYELASKADWGGDSLAHQVVVLEQIKAALARFPGSSSVFDFGMGSNGVRSIQTVSETLDIVESRRIKTQKRLLDLVGGRVCDMRREVFKAELSFEHSLALQV